MRLLTREGAEKVGASIESSGIPPICSIERAPSRNSNSRGTMSTATPASRQTRSACSSSSWWARVKAIITRSTRSSSTRSLSALRPPRQGSSRGALVAGAVIDEAREDEAELGMVVDALGEPLGHQAGADDQRALAELRGAMRGDASGRAREAGHRSARDRSAERSRRGPREAHRDEQRVHRPRHGEAGQHEPRRLADSAGPRAQVLPGVESAQERGEWPRDRDDDGQQQHLPARSARDDAHQGATGHAREHVGEEQEAAEMTEALAGGIRAASQELQLQCFCVDRHQADSRRFMFRPGILLPPPRLPAKSASQSRSRPGMTAPGPWVPSTQSCLAGSRL